MSLGPQPEMAFNYLKDRFLPVVFEDGGKGVIGLWEIGLTEGGRVPVRPDFAWGYLNDVVIELAAALLQVGMAPEGLNEWSALWHASIGPQDLKSRLAHLEPFFFLYGENPTLQVPEIRGLNSVKEWNVRKLLRDTQGCLDQADAIGIGTVAVALFAYQGHATVGGSGYVPSMSGGGPLRTVPYVGKSIFHRAWALVLDRQAFEILGVPVSKTSDLFPWTSEGCRKVSSSNGPASLVYFATPRRIIIRPPCGTGECPMGGGFGPLVSSFLEINGGTKYPSQLWRHPLAAYKRTKEGQLPIRADNFRSGVAWSSRVGIFSDQSDKNGPLSTQAAVMRAAHDRFRPIFRNGGVLMTSAYGLCYDNAHKMSSIRSEQSVRLLDPLLQPHHEHALRQLTVAGEKIFEALRDGILSARDSDESTAKPTSPERAQAASDAMAFWSLTTEAYDAYEDVLSRSLLALLDPDEIPEGFMEPEKEDVLRFMVRSAVNVLDAVIPEPSSGSMAKHAVARDFLSRLHMRNFLRAAIGLPPNTKRGVK
jgi:CRISPR type I-E-associated protein CasA/Cse1